MCKKKRMEYKYSVEIQISNSRFGVEVNVSPKPLGKLIIVDVSCKQKVRRQSIH